MPIVVNLVGSLRHRQADAQKLGIVRSQLAVAAVGKIVVVDHQQRA